MTAQGKEVKIIKPTTGEKEDLLRIGAYCRVSTDSADQLNSFFAQVQHYNDYIRETTRCAWSRFMQTRESQEHRLISAMSSSA